MSTCKNIVTLTEYEEKNLIQELGSKYLNNIVRISQAPVISDEEIFDFREKYNISMDDQIILFLGRKIKSKGYHLLLKASSDIIKKHPNSKFIFIGPHYKGSKLIFERYKDNKAILDLGQVSEREKLSALQACNLLCLPSTADVFPLTFLEAWLCKKPVVSANFPGVKNIVNHGENGLITNTEIQSISANIQFLLENKYLAQLYGENGYQKVINQYSWEKVTENIQVLYEKIIEREVETYESSNNGRGKGIRLHPYTKIIPKPLIPLNEIPILEVILRQLQYHGFTHVTLTLNYKARLIQTYFGDGKS